MKYHNALNIKVLLSLHVQDSSPTMALLRQTGLHDLVLRRGGRRPAPSRFTFCVMPHTNVIEEARHQEMVKPLIVAMAVAMAIWL